MSLPDRARYSAAWRSHRGNFRRDNEDAILIAPLGAPAIEASGGEGGCDLEDGGEGFLAAVCDGVGGGAAGEVASAVAAMTLHASLRETRDSGTARPEPGERLRAAVLAAHERLLTEVERDRALEGMGTTVTAVWFQGSTAHLAQVGDSRLYRRRGARLEQLSDDHSFVGELRRSGALGEEAARRHPLRNIVNQAVGGSKDGVQPDIRSFPVRRGDEFLLCSDGLTDALMDRTLLRLLVEGAGRPASEVAGALLQAALDTSGRDNTTVAVLRAGWQARGAIAAGTLSLQLAFMRRLGR